MGLTNYVGQSAHYVGFWVRLATHSSVPRGINILFLRRRKQGCGCVSMGDEDSLKFTIPIAHNLDSPYKKRDLG